MCENNLKMASCCGLLVTSNESRVTVCGLKLEIRILPTAPAPAYYSSQRRQDAKKTCKLANILPLAYQHINTLNTRIVSLFFFFLLTYLPTQQLNQKRSFSNFTRWNIGGTIYLFYLFKM